MSESVSVEVVPASSSTAATAAATATATANDTATADDGILVTTTECARQLCQESRTVLCSLRGGPPAVARGELAHDLQDLRVLIRAHVESSSGDRLVVLQNQNQNHAIQDYDADHHQERVNLSVSIDPAVHPEIYGPTDASLSQTFASAPAPLALADNNADDTVTDADAVDEESMEKSNDDENKKQHENNTDDANERNVGPHEPQYLSPPFVLGAGPLLSVAEVPPSFPSGLPILTSAPVPPQVSPLDLVGQFARPFLAVVMDPRAAGPHTLAALRALHRLLLQNTFQYHFAADRQAMLKGVLLCKFEQTDAGADEAVELAICSLLTLLVELDSTPATFSPLLLLDAFSTVFTTRNTLLHSPALMLHFDKLLATLCQVIFSRKDHASKLVMEFLTSILLSDYQGSPLAHDATRVLCLKLARCSLTIEWDADEVNLDNELICVIQDDLCLALLMIGQSIWAQAPGFVGLEVLSEICETLAAMWHVPAFRTVFCAQLETIFTGFYQRALVLLRKRPHPTDSTQFNENLIFDSELEVILESLVDLLCLDAESTLEILFSTYDCNLSRVDVADHLITELVRCCGAAVSDEGMATLEYYEVVHPNQRPVPPHLKELCAEAILGYLKTLFRTVPDTGTSADAQERIADPPVDENCDIGTESLSSAPPLVLVPSIAATRSKTLSHRTIKLRKRQFRKAAKLFNEDSSKGIDFLVKNDLMQGTAADVASFLRNGLVLGLDKACVGQYLGELGKPASPGKNRPCWERDWFHKEVLEQFCSLFRFENQPLIDGLRMFLASFRLPGESQQIDRIIQSFADSCGRKCDEAAKMKVFSEDPKRASDTAFLLAYSIIMLNTDRHNKVIREDKKMSKDAFVRNNSDYGRDITEKGKELPREFLESIYDNINEEEIRTEAEGAEGNMTVERWKDVLRGSTVSLSTNDAQYDPVDLKQLVVESVWMPVVSAIGAFWAVVRPYHQLYMETHEHIHSGMLSAQGARLGMDIALELLAGVRNVGRIDIFQQIFCSICDFTGLLGEYKCDAVERTSVFVNSVEAQSAVIVCLRVAQDASNDLGMDGWTRLWAMVFELRDLKMLGGGSTSQGRNFLTESDIDLLKPESRREWKLKMVKGGFDEGFEAPPESSTGFLGAFGRALFGSVEKSPSRTVPEVDRAEKVYSIHGKDELILWDEFASSDYEDDESENTFDVDYSIKEKPVLSRFSSPGSLFESQLIHEDILIQHRTDMPVTGLERVEDTRPHQLSPRARVRKRLARACDFAGLITESRFMELGGVVFLLKSLVQLISLARNQAKVEEKQDDDATSMSPFSNFVMSPASEAVAEVLLCEIAIKNKDRLGALWSSVLEGHYSERLQALQTTYTDDEEHPISFIEPGTEKCVTGLLRLSACAAQKEDLANEVISSLSLLPIEKTPREIEELDLHISEGLWRICSGVDGLLVLDEDAWLRLLALIQWCAARAGKRASSSGLSDDDPGLQAYRSLHLIVGVPELRDRLPPFLADVISTLVARTAYVGCTKLSLASLDLLHVYQSRLESMICESAKHSDILNEVLVGKWTHALDAVAQAAWGSRDSVSFPLTLIVFQMLTDLKLTLLISLCILDCEVTCHVHHYRCLP